MKDKELTPAQIQYYSMMRQATPEELEQLARRQAEGMRAMTEKEIREHQLKMLKMRF